MASNETVELPEDAAFWALVELANRDWGQFAARLRELSTPAIAGIAHMFFGFEASLAERSRTLLPSEDSADDFCGWVVSRGKDHYVRAITDPGILDAGAVAEFDRDRRRCGDSAIRYEAESAYHERTGEHLAAFSEPEYDPYDSEEYGPLLRAWS